MNIDKWIAGYKVRAFPWVDSRRIYFNVQYFEPGKSIERPPLWEKTVYIMDNEAGRRLVEKFTHTLTEYVAGIQIPKNCEITITVGQGEVDVTA